MPAKTGHLIFSVCLLIMSVSGEEEKPIPADIITGNNACAIEVYQKLKSEHGNLFFSPYSISTAMAMTYEGARSNTEKQMSAAMHFDIDQKKFHTGFAEIQRHLNEYEKSGAIKLEIANSLFLQKNFAFLPAFLEEAKKYDAGLNYVDFVSKTEKARKAINAWVEKKTNEKIKELVSAGVLDATTRLVLANAIYFKGKWAAPFDSSATKNMPFYGESNTIANASMMRKSGKGFGFMENSMVQCLEIPYAGNELSMFVVLPKTNDGLAELEKTLTEANLSSWTKSIHKEKVLVFFPRFKILKSFSLTRELSAMGMPDAFSGAADFSGMTGTKELFISDVIHKAFIDVNEEGTEAAASTAVTIQKLRGEINKPITFRADHPFIFLIRDNQSGAILFMGRITDPRDTAG